MLKQYDLAVVILDRESDGLLARRVSGGCNGRAQRLQQTLLLHPLV